MSKGAFGTGPIGQRYGAANVMRWLSEERIVVGHGASVSFLDGATLEEGTRVSVGSSVNSVSVGADAILVCAHGSQLVVLDKDTLEEKSRTKVEGVYWGVLAADGTTAVVVRKGRPNMDELDRVRIADGDSVASKEHPRRPISAGAVMTPGATVATLDWSGVHIVEPAPGARIAMDDASCHTLASDKTLIVGSTKGTVRRVDFGANGKHTMVWETPIGKSRTRCMHAEFGVVGVADDDGVTAMFDLDDGKEIARWKIGKGMRVVMPSPNGKRALVAGQAAGNVLAPTRVSLLVPGKTKPVVSKLSQEVKG